MKHNVVIMLFKGDGNVIDLKIHSGRSTKGSAYYELKVILEGCEFIQESIQIYLDRTLIYTITPSYPVDGLASKASPVFMYCLN